jgi:hypothetical protein
MQHGNCSQLTALLLQNYHKLSYYIRYQHTVTMVSYACIGIGIVHCTEVF